MTGTEMLDGVGGDQPARRRDPAAPEWFRPLRQCVTLLRERANDVDREASYPHRSMEIVHEHGLLNAVAPESLGGHDLGPGGDLWGYFHLLDNLATGCASTAQLVGVHFAAMATVKAVGTDAQLERFAMATRDDAATFCYLGSEPTQRFTVTGGRSRHQSSARRVEGGWVIDADKFFATGSMGCRYVMPLCMTEGATDLSGLLVPVLSVDDPGVEIRDTWDNMGQRSTTSGICQIRDVFVPDEMTIGGPGDFLEPRTIGPMFQLTFAAMFNGIAQGALDFTIDYLSNHATPPLGFERAMDEPQVAPLIGDMSVKIEAGRALVRRAAELLTGIEQEWADLGEATRAVNQAQVHAAQASVEIGSNLFRLCGARATSSKFNADMYWRNARTLTLHDNLDRQLTAIGRSVLDQTE